MTDAIYPTLSRQTGLLREIDVIAQNIANAGTTGYRAEGVIFSEHVLSAPDMPSISMAHGTGRRTQQTQGGLERTGGAFDLAIEGPGYFLIDVAGAPHLTRAGAFTTGPDGALLTPEGHAVLDEAETPIFVPTDATAVHVGQDGTISADGAPVAQVAIVAPDDPLAMSRHAGTLFASDGFAPVEDPQVAQGFLEASNVDPVTQIARMIVVQNAYQMGQGFMDREDERMRSMLRLMDQ